MERAEQYNMSIVMAVHDQAQLLEQNLPQFMDIATQTGCEVIVVDDASTDETPDILKRMKDQFAHLYTTFLPKSVCNNSRLRLALTIGVKAARSHRVILADISRPPVSKAWVTALQGDHGEIAIVYCHRKSEIGSVTRLSFDELEAVRPMIIKAERKGGHGHQGRWNKTHRGLYDALAFSDDCWFDGIRFFDQSIGALRLLSLRQQVHWKSLFLHPETIEPEQKP